MNPEADPHRVQRTVLRLAAFISGLIALLALTGWHFHQTRLVQWSPGIAPMQYNTALGTLLCSAGIFLASSLRAPRTILCAGGTAALLGLVTLTEYLTSLDLPIDQFLFKSWIVTGTAYPGRMGANTAVCMALTGLALMLMAVPGRRRWYSVATALAGSAVGIISLVAVVGYSMRVESGYRWGYLTQMSENTTVAFLAIGSGLLTSALFDAGKGRPLHYRYTPLIVGVASVFFTFLLWQALVGEGNSNLRRRAVAASVQVTFEVQAQLANLDGALQRIARRWPAERKIMTGPRNGGQWEFDAAEYIVDFPGLAALKWRDETSSATRIWPPNFAHNQAYFKLGRRPDGFVLMGPRKVTEPTSHTLAVVNYEFWLAAVLHKEVATGYSVAVAADGEDVFKRVYGSNGTAPQAVVLAPVDVAGTRWEVRVWPGPAIMASSASQLTNLMLLGGVIREPLADADRSPYLGRRRTGGCAGGR